MASARPNILPNFILTPQQQNLLFRALTSNQPNAGNADQDTLTPESLTTSPVHNQGAMGFNDANGPSDSPFLDYNYDIEPDTSYDFEFDNENQVDAQGRMIGDLPGSSPEGSDVAKDTSKANSPENETSDKRSHPDEDDDDEGENGAKRREGEGKVAKKPGRKPLTNEPSSKRKAQNRAAQRAFRERKEKHLKDLETKVEELEKASSAANNENSQLRAQLEKLNSELEQYKKLSAVSTRSRPSTGSSRGHSTFGSAAIQNINDVNFQFEFPRFGMFPGPNMSPSTSAKQTSSYPSPSSSRSPNSQTSPPDQSKTAGSNDHSKNRQNSDGTQANDLFPSSVKYSDLFNNSSSLDGASGNGGSRTSLDSAQFSLNGTNTGSPSSSSNSIMGPSSSCGTSPEPFTQSPLGFKPLETLTTIGEEQPGLTSENTSAFGNLSNFGNLDFTNIDWLAQQNGGQFDPQLFGNYREPQSNVLANTTFDDSFFNDAFEVDFMAPFNAPTVSSPKPVKKDICAEIDARKETEDTIQTSSNGKLLTCNNIWEQLQGCPKVQSGDLDLDGLCSDLQKKAKCGGTGAVVDEKDFQAVMTKYLGGSCPNS
ncbi:putative transcription factor PAP1 [Rosellinia necatrix]|uniref:Putative transcription factor PAP1 n=1 Tax=Rosellinia necatrix TaxID=77044 RepID=A0A1W2TFG0_ROSNE|nr:putative transcription factor PAP1 [Rosellinia necatrix]